MALLVAACGVGPAPTSVTVARSNISFSSAIAACPSGTLGAISVALGHVRVAEGPGVTTDVDDTDPNAQTVTLTSGSKTATATVNASKDTVKAKNVKLASRNRVACVAPD